MATALKIALIADIHHGIDIGTKLGSAALTLMQPFVDWVNAIQPTYRKSPSLFRPPPRPHASACSPPRPRRWLRVPAPSGIPPQRRPARWSTARRGLGMLLRRGEGRASGLPGGEGPGTAGRGARPGGCGGPAVSSSTGADAPPPPLSPRASLDDVEALDSGASLAVRREPKSTVRSQRILTVASSTVSISHPYSRNTWANISQSERCGA